MGFKGFRANFYEFFIELTHNNHKTWFDENRSIYEKLIKPEFYSFWKNCWPVCRRKIRFLKILQI